MNEEQIKQKAFDEAVKYSSLGYEQTPFADGYIAGAHSRDEEIEELRNSWISVEERLPENYKGEFSIGVFVRGVCDIPGNCIINHEFYGHDYYDYQKKEWSSHHHCTQGDWKVTHWMPIPQIKKGE